MLFPLWYKLQRVLHNGYDYVGQNDLRSFILKKTFSDIYRLVICNRQQSMLKDDFNKEVVAVIAHALQSTHEDSVMNPGNFLLLHGETFALCIPRPLYAAVTTAPQPPYPEEIEIFNPEKPAWPPKFYYN